MVITGHKRGDEMSPKKMGRPTDNPKGASIHVRLDKTCSYILSAYTEQENVTKAEAIRRGVLKLEADLKN